MQIIKVNNLNELSIKAAEIIQNQIYYKNNSVLGLATGSTPLGAYAELIKLHQIDKLDFSNVKTINLDEYCGLGVNDEQSYSYYMNHHLFNHVNINHDNINIPNGLARSVEEECIRYDKVVESLEGIDLQLLGIGDNGHIGFNEPSDELSIHTHKVKLHDSTIEANSRFFNSVDDTPKYAITLGMGPILEAKHVLLIAGKSKVSIVKKALYGPVTPKLPASYLQNHPNLTVIQEI
jgi:glucosamine-6-phosphate deaminase